MKEKKVQRIQTLIDNFITKYSVNKILIAISGGQDSTYLIKTMENFNKKTNKKK